MATTIIKSPKSARPERNDADDDGDDDDSEQNSKAEEIQLGGEPDDNDLSQFEADAEPSPNGRPTKGKPHPLTPDLDDTKKFTKLSAVPLMDTHSGDANHSPVDLQKLQLYQHNGNERSKTGNFAVVALGHTTNNGKEIDQPEPVGFSKNFKVGEYAGGPCLLGDLYIANDKLDYALTFPRRSVELWNSNKLEDNFIDMVSLIRRTPERDLGTLYRFQKVKERYAMTSAVPLTNPGQAAPDVPCPPNDTSEDNTMLSPEDVQTIVGAVLHALKADKEATAAAAPPAASATPPAPPVAPPAGPPETAEKFGEGGGDDPTTTEVGKPLISKPGFNDEINISPTDNKFAPDRNAAEPCGTNTFTPGNVGKEKERMSRDANTAGIERYQKELESAKAEIAVLQRFNRRNVRAAEIDKLEKEGYQINKEVELNEVTDLDEKSFVKYVTRVRENYRRSPTNQRMLEMGEPLGGSPGLSKEDIGKVPAFAAAHKIVDGEAAVKAYLAAKNKV